MISMATKSSHARATDLATHHADMCKILQLMNDNEEV